MALQRVINKREGSYELHVRSWSGTESQVGMGILHVTVLLGENPTLEEHIAFQHLLSAIQRLKELTR